MKHISSYDLGAIKSAAEFLVQLSHWEAQSQLAHWERNVIDRLRVNALKDICERTSRTIAVSPEPDDLPL